MSITSHLADTNSEGYKFFRERLPNTRRLVTAYDKQIKDTKTIRPSEPCQGRREGVPSRFASPGKLIVRKPGV